MGAAKGLLQPVRWQKRRAKTLREERRAVGEVRVVKKLGFWDCFGVFKKFKCFLGFLVLLKFRSRVSRDKEGCPNL